jgi:hypothetical protein
MPSIFLIKVNPYTLTGMFVSSQSQYKAPSLWAVFRSWRATGGGMAGVIAGVIAGTMGSEDFVMLRPSSHDWHMCSLSIREEHGFFPFFLRRTWGSSEDLGILGLAMCSPPPSPPPPSPSLPVSLWPGLWPPVSLVGLCRAGLASSSLSARPLRSQQDGRLR